MMPCLHQEPFLPVGCFYLLFIVPFLSNLIFTHPDSMELIFLTFLCYWTSSHKALQALKDHVNITFLILLFPIISKTLSILLRIRILLDITGSLLMCTVLFMLNLLCTIKYCKWYYNGFHNTIHKLRKSSQKLRKGRQDRYYCQSYSCRKSTSKRLSIWEMRDVRALVYASSYITSFL